VPVSVIFGFLLLITMLYRDELLPQKVVKCEKAITGRLHEPCLNLSHA